MQYKRSKKLNSIEPGEWLRRLSKIGNEKIRIKIACIVWWDFVSKKKREEWLPIHSLVEKFKPICYLLPAYAVENALIKIGYSGRVAKIRSHYKPSSPVTIKDNENKN